MNAKKLLALALALVMCIACFAGCGNTDVDPGNESSTPFHPEPR